MSNSNNHRDVIETLGSAFKCPKCRGDQAHARRVRLPTAKLSTLFHREPGEFVFVTCALCGYTEVYDLAVYAHAKDSKMAKAHAGVNPAPGT